MPEPIILRTFAAGEIAPVLHARADQARYQSGLKRCRNFLVRREGGVSNRGGLRFIGSLKATDAGTRIFPYIGSVQDETCLVEMGDGYLRFWQDGAAVEVSSVPAWSAATDYVIGDLVARSGVNYYCITAHIAHGPPNVAYWYPLAGNVYEIPTPFTLAAGLPTWNQSGNVITFTHSTMKPRELVFEELTRWVLRELSTAPSIATPTGVAGTRNAAGTLTTRYKVTAAAAESYEESDVSSEVVIYNHDTLSTAKPNEVWWGAVSGAVEYHVYADRDGNGTYGYIGTSTGKTVYRDGGVAADLDSSPPVARSLFASSNDYPRLSAQYQQRRYFANTVNAPDAIWGSRIGFPSNFGISSPLQDDDSVTFRLAGNNHHPVRWMVALKSGLVLLTDGGEWTVTGGGGAGSPISPSSISADQETYVGASATVRPVVVGENILYIQARGSILRDIAFRQDVQGLAGNDLTVWSSHLIERKTIVAMDYQQVPHSTIWCVRSDGTLLGVTYLREHDLVGWHRHDTVNGLFEDVAVLPEDDEDAVYVIVARVIGGSTVRYLERLERRDVREGADFNGDIFFVDSGLSYTGAPADVFGGLDHLQGQVVAVVADGEVIFDGDSTSRLAPRYTVTGGVIVLDAEYSDVHIGLPVRAEIETLSLDVQGSDARARVTRTNGLTLLVEKSSRGFLAGPDDDHLVKHEQDAWDTGAAKTGPLALSIDADWAEDGHVLVVQSDPLPLTILGVIPTADLGGV